MSQHLALLILTLLIWGKVAEGYAKQLTRRLK